MSDTYQAVYDAVRSKLSFGNIHEAVVEAVSGQISGFNVMAIQQDFCIAAAELQRPSVLFRPTLKQDGDQWCALYGPNLQEGFTAFGKTADEAMRAFDSLWLHATALK